jgi:L-threonylcarbamoyladenylate synthase
MQFFDSFENDQLITAIKGGAVGVIPTDTVYGLVCAANDSKAVARLYALKSREHKPGTLIAADINQLVKLGIKKRYLTAVGQFWPGPVSVIIPTGFALDYLRQGVVGLATRIPAQSDLHKLLEATGPLITTSANQPGESPANNLQEARDYFGDTVDFYVDGGDLSGALPSTLIRIVDDAIEVLRQGAVEINESQ